MNFAPDLANSCSALLTLGSIFIGVTIILLFLGETSDLEILKISSIGFFDGCGVFFAGAGLFLAETLQATKLLKFAELSVNPRP